MKEAPMTTGRDIKKDQAVTAHLLSQIGDDSFDKLDYVSWLGHTGGGGLADALLLIGATEEQLKIARPKSLDQHIYHLQSEHGLTVQVENGIYRLVNPQI